MHTHTHTHRLVTATHLLRHVLQGPDVLSARTVVESPTIGVHLVLADVSCMDTHGSGWGGNNPPIPPIPSTPRPPVCTRLCVVVDAERVVTSTDAVSDAAAITTAMPNASSVPRRTLTGPSTTMISAACWLGGPRCQSAGGVRGRTRKGLPINQ
jgi:hypothetical protein